MRGILNHKGSILSQILFIFMILSMLCLVLVNITNMDFLIFYNTKNSTAAFYVAESGLELALQRESLGGFISYPYSLDIIESHSQKTIGTCLISKSGDAITSRGHVGKISRTMRAVYEKNTGTGQNTLEEFWITPYKYETLANKVINPASTAAINNLINNYDFVYVYIPGGSYCPSSVTASNKNRATVLVINGNFTPDQPIEFYGILYVTGKILLHPGSKIHGYVYSGMPESNSIDVVEFSNNGISSDTDKVVINGVIHLNTIEDIEVVNYNEDKIITRTIENKNTNNHNSIPYEKDVDYGNWVVENLFQGKQGSTNIRIKSWKEVRQ